MKLHKLITFLSIGLLAIACNKQKSLQEYYVEKQDDNKFIAVDIPTSLFANLDNFDAEEKAIIESVRKVNVLALPLKNDTAYFEKQKTELQDILRNEDYQLLMKVGNSDQRGSLYFTGKEDAIDEIIAFGYSNKKGMGVARILGDNMNPEKIMKLLKSLDKEDVNLKGLESLEGIFDHSDKNSKNQKSGVSVNVKVDTVTTE
ncbi:DUF4252 domain-containing protein [Zunongwangia sp.]|uniref:DUF4252 domain-containing protein n=1 Tax=Zunongwangia sp. TaxID=1965325 RepID=UPI003AA845B8